MQQLQADYSTLRPRKSLCARDTSTSTTTATHRPQQSGIVAGRSTIDAILGLRLLSELHLNVAYLDIKAAFDSGTKAHDSETQN